jgi:superfamily I DNA/RNA helicase
LIPSPYQQAIYDWIEHGTGNAVVDAVAGAGKTSALLEGAKRLKTTNACFVAFNKVIADEIASRLQAISLPIQASTIHSLGKRCLVKALVEDKKYTKLCRMFIQGLPERELVLKETPEATAVKHLRALVNFAQLTMTEPTEANLRHLVEHYALDGLLSLMAVNGLLWETLWQGVRIIVEAGIEQYQRERILDFNDMVCLPTVPGLPKPQFDFLLMDEAQDLNWAQLELVLACTSPRGACSSVGINDNVNQLVPWSACRTATNCLSRNFSLE